MMSVDAAGMGLVDGLGSNGLGVNGRAAELSASRGVSVRGRRPGSFSLGMQGAIGAQAVESLPAMAKAATQSGTRSGKLTPAQIEARAQQRSEDDDLIREAQRGQ